MSMTPMMRLISITAGLLLSLTAQAAEIAGKPLAAKADEYMQARLKVSKFSGSLLVAQGGQTLFEHGYGLASIEYDVPNTPKTKFRLASVSKQFTATGIMLLEAEGKLKVDAPLKTYLPDCPKAWCDVTIHQLLSHTSGVPENLRPALFKGLWPQVVDLDHLLDIVKDRPLDFKPGEKWSYSNTGYVLLGMVIEKTSGKPYGDFLKERIFEPLDMKDTGVDNRRLVLKNRAMGYGIYRSQTVPAQYIEMSQVYSAGSLYSTVEDLLKWDTALYSEKILPQKALERMWTPVKDDYGYGWAIVKPAGRKLITHNGGLPGFTTTVMRYPERKVYVTVLCNMEGSAMAQIARDLAAMALGDPYDIPVKREEAMVDPKTFDAYVGEFEIKGKGILTISKSDGRLYAQRKGQGRIQVIPESETKFFARETEATFAFVKDDKGQANELIIHQNGRDDSGKRVVKPPEKKDDKKADKKDEKKDEKKKDG